MTNQELESCPFCGNNKPVIHITEPANNSMFVYCGNMDCNIQGPLMGTVQEAVKAWNTRQPSKTELVYKKRLEKLWEQVVLYDSECRAICKHQVRTSCILFSGLDETKKEEEE